MIDGIKRWRPKHSELARAITLVVEFEKPGEEGAYVDKLRQCVEELKQQGVPVLGWSETAVCRTCHGRGRVPDPEKGIGDLWGATTCPACRGAGRPGHLFPEHVGAGESD